MSEVGTLYTCYLGKDKIINLPDNTIKYLIVRKPLSIPKGFKHKPELSPSLELFNDCMYKWKVGILNEEEEKYLKDLGIWEFKDYASYIWWDLYTLRFLKEIPQMEENIKDICNILDKGINVCVYCYCKDFNFCHRILIGQEFQKRGYNVIFM